MKRKTVGEIRPSQLITTFGPGAIVDLRRDSAVVAAIDAWPEGRILNERVLQERLGTTGFRCPVPDESAGALGGVPVLPFPDHHVCPQCRRLVDLSQTPVETRAKQGPSCPTCSKGRRRVQTHPARIITVCRDGHMDDFPWSWWVHKGADCPGGTQSALYLKSRGSASTLGDLNVSCQGCGAFRTLQGALGPSGLKGWPCSGRRPWVPDDVPGGCTRVGGSEDGPRGSLRGATNLYFSAVASQLSIPPWSDPLEKEIARHRNTFLGLKAMPEVLHGTAQALLGQLGFQPEEIKEAVDRWLDDTPQRLPPRESEYHALATPPTGMKQGDFRSRKGAHPEGFKLSQLVLVEKLREVRAIVGFSRINAPDPEDPQGKSLPLFAHARPSWLPGAELHGEGLFLQFDEAALQRWEAEGDVQSRVQFLLDREGQQRAERGWTAIERRPAFLFLHTFAHLFMGALALECGYSAAALRERLYLGPGYNGVLIYTGTADADGSLGGLLQQGEPARLIRVLRRAVETARLCSGDPLCRERDPRMIPNTLNGVACHACTLASETSCEQRNQLLDRALIVTLPGQRVPGFFDGP